MEFSIKPWRCLTSEEELNVGFFKVVNRKVESFDRSLTAPYYIVETKDWTGIIPLTNDKEIVMIEQFRHGSRELSLEIPGGVLDDGEPEAGALRELEEETGFTATKMVPLVKVRPNAALIDNTLHTFVALGAHKVKSQELELMEDIAVRLVPVEEVRTLIRSGEIIHGTALTALFLFFLEYDAGAFEIS